MDRKQEIIERQREIDTTIVNLYAERKKISAELRKLKQEDNKDSLTKPVLELESKWSQKLPTVNLSPSHSRPNPAYKSSGWGYLFVDEKFEDFSISAHYKENYSDNKCIASVEIRKRRGAALFTTKKTFKDFDEMQAESPELFYQAVVKAAKKLI